MEVLRRISGDLPWLVGLALAGALYVVGYLRLRRRHPRLRHSGWKAGAFLAGLVLAGAVATSPFARFADRALSVNFGGLLVLTMIAAPLILLGSPLTLAFRVSGRAGRKRLRKFYRGPVMTILGFPIVSWLAFAVVTYAWQLTRLTDDAARHTPVRDIQLVTLLAVALLFWWPALCADPVPWRMAHPLRGLYVFVEMTHKALFGAMFLSLNHPVHPYFASHLPAWAPGAMLDQRVAIGVLWVGGNLVFLTALAGIVAKWMQYEGRYTRRVDLRLAAAREDERQRRAALGQVFDRTV